MDLDGVADELYALPLEVFTSTRAMRTAEAKDSGNRELAAQIRSLAKPNQVAWLANQLTRQRRDQVAALLELAEQFRDATGASDSDRLRELARQRQQVLATLTGQAREIAAAAGRGFSPETARGLEDTLRAAMADPQAADQLRSGRLTDALQASGFGFGAGEPRAPKAHQPQQPQQPQPPASSSRSAQTPPRRVPGQAQHERKALAAADRTLAAARADATQAVAALRAAQDGVDSADRGAAQLQETVTRLRTELDVAQRALAEMQSQRRRAGRDLDDASRKAAASQRRLEHAMSARDDLAPPDAGQ